MNSNRDPRHADEEHFRGDAAGVKQSQCDTVISTLTIPTPARRDRGGVGSTPVSWMIVGAQ